MMLIRACFEADASRSRLTKSGAIVVQKGDFIWLTQLNVPEYTTVAKLQN